MYSVARRHTESCRCLQLTVISDQGKVSAEHTDGVCSAFHIYVEYFLVSESYTIIKTSLSSSETIRRMWYLRRKRGYHQRGVWQGPGIFIKCTQSFQLIYFNSERIKNQGLAFIVAVRKMKNNKALESDCFSCVSATSRRKGL